MTLNSRIHSLKEDRVFNGKTIVTKSKNPIRCLKTLWKLRQLEKMDNENHITHRSLTLHGDSINIDEYADYCYSTAKRAIELFSDRKDGKIQTVEEMIANKGELK